MNTAGYCTTCGKATIEETRKQKNTHNPETGKLDGTESTVLVRCPEARPKYDQRSGRTISTNDHYWYSYTKVEHIETEVD